MTARYSGCGTRTEQKSEQIAMTYRAPVAEQRFVLEVASGLPQLAEAEAFAAASPDLVDAILEGAAQFAEGEFAPLNHPGDKAGARWTAEGVIMPPGFREAYQAYVESGWGSLSCPESYG